jgi:ubiquinone/menaquinone biosynthesis C-methylase UbiE
MPTMPAPAPASAEQIRDANTRYHDAAARSYDEKWGIDFGEVGRGQVLTKLEKALGFAGARFGDALEIGAGTGYFSLNLVRVGAIRRATATDISPGMLQTLAANAADLGLEVETVVGEAEQLAFADESFDLVFGHAVLHHIPDLERALAEFARVLRPGGRVAFCGEPSRYGDLLAALPKRAARAISPLWRRALGARVRTGFDRPQTDGEWLEWQVDVHSFTPAELRRMLQGAGLVEPRIRGEELLANLYGWGLRTVESTAEFDDVPERWRTFAFRSYLALQRLDEGLLEPRLPPQLFYNLVLSARKPGPPAG